MFTRTVLAVAVPLLLGGAVSCRNSDTGGESGKPGAPAPSAAATSAGPRQGSAAKEAAGPQAEVVRFRLLGFPITGLPMRIDAVEPDGSVVAIREDIDLEKWRHLFQIADGHPIGEIPTLRPTPDHRRRQIPVLEIPRDKLGASARLVFETFAPEERRPPAARQIQTSNNLKQLVLALHSYHDAYKSFPAAYSTDKEGKPLLSWRVRVLPFLQKKAIYDQFHLNEPWDSDHNKQLIAKMPAVFRSPASKAEPGKTNYLGVGGPKGIFPGKDSIAFRDITDGSSNTIAIVEVNDQAAVIWTKPDDFVPDPQQPKRGLLGLWPGGFHTAMADGSVQFRSETIDDRTLQALLTRNGGEFVKPLDGAASVRPPRPVAVTEAAAPAVEAEVPAVAVPPPWPPTTAEEAVAQIEKRGGKLLVKGFKSSWSPDGRRLAFGKTPAGAGICVVEVETGKVKDLDPAGKDPAWSPGEGRWIAYVRGDGTEEEVWVVPAQGGEPRRVAQGGFPNWAPDAKSLFIQSRASRKLQQVSLDAQDAAPNDVLDVAWWYPAVSPDGKRVAYRTGRQVVVVDRESDRTLRRWAMPGSGRGWLGGWSPDGKQLGFGGYGGGDLVGCCIVDVETGKAFRLAAGQATMPAWSPDGSTLALDLRLPGGWEVWTLSASALKTLPPVDLTPDRYAMPEESVAELGRFIDELRALRPTSPQETAMHQTRGRQALKHAAQRLLQLESDESKKVYQTAVLVLVEDRARDIAGASPEQQREIVDYFKKYLEADTHVELAREAAQLALAAAQALEKSNQRELAAEAYQGFAGLIAKRKDEKLAEIAATMEKAARRLAQAGKKR